MVFTFSQLGGRAAAFEVKVDEGQVIASGKRIP